MSFGLTFLLRRSKILCANFRYHFNFASPISNPVAEFSKYPQNLWISL